MSLFSFSLLFNEFLDTTFKHSKFKFVMQTQYTLLLIISLYVARQYFSQSFFMGILNYIREYIGIYLDFLSSEW